MPGPNPLPPTPLPPVETGDPIGRPSHPTPPEPGLTPQNPNHP